MSDDAKTSNKLTTANSLETVDAVARAAHLWIRSLCLNEVQTEEERYALASGLVAGLCERLALSNRIKELVTYVYTLLESESCQALAVSRLMLDLPVPRYLRGAYERGKAEAVGIVEMLRYHDAHRRQQDHQSNEEGD